MENKLRTAELIDDSALGHGVQLGSIVVLKNVETGTESEYTLVGSDEADPFSGLMSNESPIGAAIKGHAEEMCIRDSGYAGGHHGSCQSKGTRRKR